MQAAFYKLEEKSCKQYIDRIEKEIKNRNNGDKQEEEFSNLTNEELLKYKKMLENDFKIIHDLYRSVVPSWLNANSDAIQGLVISAALQILQHNGNGEKAKQYMQLLNLKF